MKQLLTHILVHFDVWERTTGDGVLSLEENLWIIKKIIWPEMKAYLLPTL